MGQAKNRGTKEQRTSQAIEIIKAQMSAFPVMYFGYDRQRREDESPFEISQDGLVCMVSNIAQDNQKPLQESTGIDFQMGQWFASSGVHGNTVVKGPFGDAYAAMDFSKANFGAVRFNSAPTFEPPL